MLESKKPSTLTETSRTALPEPSMDLNADGAEQCVVFSDGEEEGQGRELRPSQT